MRLQQPTSRIRHQNRVLVIDDDADIVELLQIILRKGGYDSLGITNTKEIDLILSDESFALMIVDRNLPCREGSELVQTLRESGNTTPVIFITAKDSREEKLEGFLKGGDDYITKPFDNDEVLLRVEALLRRSSVSGFNRVLSHRDIEMDLDKFTLSIASSEIRLTKLEFKLLQIFLENIGSVLERDYLLDTVWNCGVFDEHCNEKSVNVAVKRLKTKIDRDGSKNYIESIRGVGYRLQ
jgi:DNA-binding response OmpR family regulator